MKKSYTNPVYENAADPFVLLYDGKYYLYSTNAAPDGYKVSVSDDLITWEDKGFCLKKEDVMGENGFWAPEVMYYEGKFYIIYTSEENIGVAVADSPLGPFKQDEKKWLVERAIDGHFFKDDDGNVYVYYANMNDENDPKAICRVGGISGAKMNADMKSMDETTKKYLLEGLETEWERIMDRVIEGPFMLKHNGKYYLTYSANNYMSVYYGVGYAVSDSPLGAFEKYEGNPILCRSDEIYGTGHHSFTTSKNGKKLVCVYHCHNSAEKIHPRRMCIDTAEFVPSEDGGDDVLVINGPTSEEMPAIN